jgi:hypothetical protein
MKVRLTLPVSLTSRQAHWSRSYPISAYHSISFSVTKNVSRASDATSTVVEYVGIDHCRLHVLVVPVNPESCDNTYAETDLEMKAKALVQLAWTARPQLSTTSTLPGAIGSSRCWRNRAPRLRTFLARPKSYRESTWPRGMHHEVSQHR